MLLVTVTRYSFLEITVIMRFCHFENEATCTVPGVNFSKNVLVHRASSFEEWCSYSCTDCLWVFDTLQHNGFVSWKFKIKYMSKVTEPYFLSGGAVSVVVLYGYIIHGILQSNNFVSFVNVFKFTDPPILQLEEVQWLSLWPHIKLCYFACGLPCDCTSLCEVKGLYWQGICIVSSLHCYYQIKNFYWVSSSVICCTVLYVPVGEDVKAFRDGNLIFMSLSCGIFYCYAGREGNLPCRYM